MATFLSAVYAIPHFIFKLIVRLKYAISKISNFGYFYLAQNELHIYVKICIGPKLEDCAFANFDQDQEVTTRDFAWDDMNFMKSNLCFNQLKVELFDYFRVLFNSLEKLNVRSFWPFY